MSRSAEEIGNTRPRTGFVSPVHDFTLEIINRGVLNEELFTNKLPNIDGVRLVYTTLIQSGLERISFLENSNAVASLPPLRGRVRYRRDQGYAKALAMASEGLATVRKDIHPKQRELVGLCVTLADILYALQTHQPIISLFSLPDISRIETALPSEIALPINILFHSFRDVSTLAPIPVLEIDRKSVVILEEILGSRTYSSYVRCHEGLTDARVARSRATAMIRKASDFLVERYRLFDLKRTFMTVLPLSARLYSIA